jgi:hypothetical protein
MTDTRGIKNAILGRIAHLAIVLVLATAVTLAVHDVGYILTRGYWQDESWVALIGRYALSDLPSLTSSTPIGWDFAQRLFLPLGEQAPRLLALIFAVLASAAGYLIGYVSWQTSAIRRVSAGAVVSIAVTFSATLLVRNDLKQYTADAFVALLVFALVVLAARHQRSALIALTVVSGLGLFLSLTTAFVAVGAFGALALADLLKKDYKRFRSVLLYGAFAGAAILLEYLFFYLRASGNPKLTAYWVNYFPTIGELPGRVASGYGQFFRVQGPGVGIAVTAIVFAAIALYAVLAVRSKQVAPALFYPTTLVLLCILGLAHFYPLLNDRTSTFFAAITIAIASVGLVRLGYLIVDVIQAQRAKVVLSIVGILGLMLLSVVPNRQWVRSHMIPYESGMSQVEYIEAHFRPGDTIVTNEFGVVALAFYWPELDPGWHPTPTRPYGWDVTFAANRNVVRADLEPGGLEAIVAARKSSGVAQTIWILQTHSRLPGSDKIKTIYNVNTVPFPPDSSDRVVFGSTDEALRFITLGP